MVVGAEDDEVGETEGPVVKEAGGGFKSVPFGAKLYTKLGLIEAVEAETLVGDEAGTVAAGAVPDEAEGKEALKRVPFGA